MMRRLVRKGSMDIESDVEVLERRGILVRCNNEEGVKVYDLSATFRIDGT